MIAALYVMTGGGYFDLPDVDPWDIERDAMLYGGPYPVVAHPPCAAWCQLIGVREARHGLPRYVDGGTFKSALEAVQRWGGVLEHPAYSHAWARHGLPQPGRRGWQQGICGGWSCEVAQSAYGHVFKKKTWLYWFGVGTPLALEWEQPEGTQTLRWGMDNHKYPERPEASPKLRLGTPPAFRKALVDLARASRA